eukprot:847680-Pyramimonas_sp.AAC.1
MESVEEEKVANKAMALFKKSMAKPKPPPPDRTFGQGLDLRYAAIASGGQGEMAHPPTTRERERKGETER